MDAQAKHCAIPQVAVGPIPIDGRGQTVFKAHPWRPVEGCTGGHVVERITRILTLAIRPKTKSTGAEQAVDPPRCPSVFHVLLTGEVPSRLILPATKARLNSPGKVLNKKPIANRCPLAMDRQRPSPKRT